MLKIRNITINWEYQKEKLREKYTILTERDLNFEQGKMEVMLTKLQIKLGKTRHEIYNIIANL